MSSLKTIVLLAGFAVVMAAVFNVKGLKLSHGIWIGAGLVLVGSLIPENQQTAAA